MSKLFRAVVKVVKVQSYTDFPLSANISCHSKKVPRTMPQRHKCEFKKKKSHLVVVRTSQVRVQKSRWKKKTQSVDGLVTFLRDEHNAGTVQN